MSSTPSISPSSPISDLSRHSEATPDLRSPTSDRSSEAEILVSVENISKKFCRNLKKSLWYGMKDVVTEMNPFGRREAFALDEELPLRPGEFWANHNISFELRRGECIGLIGRNGAGKTTLLKMLNGLIKPDSGRIIMRGRIGALIALGAGFNPILTGRENIYVNGSILGLSKKEVDSKIDDIIEFAEIHDFIDAPVQSYSSGMQVRLGFAVATALEPDILILDEVLAVGDAAFRSKCYQRIGQLRKKAAIIFVSHSMEQVGRICDSAIFLVGGRAEYLGPVAEGVERYEQDNTTENQEAGFLSIVPPVLAFEAHLPATLKYDESFEVKLNVSCGDPIGCYALRMIVYSASGTFAADLNLDCPDDLPVMNPGSNELRFKVMALNLKRGRYLIAFNLIDTHGTIIAWSYKQHPVEIKGTHINAVADCQLLTA